MKTFNVYHHPTTGFQAVKRGFSWPAFFFSWIWAFSKGLWTMGVALLGVQVVMLLLVSQFEANQNDGGVLLILLQFTLHLVTGLLGNDWQRRALVRNGFKKIRTVMAESPEAAIGNVTTTIASHNAGWLESRVP